MIFLLILFPFFSYFFFSLLIIFSSVPVIRTRTKATEKSEVEEEKFINLLAEISTETNRVGLHHEFVGYLAPQLLALIWSCVPLYNRAYRNSHRASLFCSSSQVLQNNQKFEDLWWPHEQMSESYNYLNSNSIAASWFGTSKLQSWNSYDQLTAFLCLIGISAVLADVVARFYNIFSCCNTMVYSIILLYIVIDYPTASYYICVLAVILFVVYIASSAIPMVVTSALTPIVNSTIALISSLQTAGSQKCTEITKNIEKWACRRGPLSTSFHVLKKKCTERTKKIEKWTSFHVLFIIFNLLLGKFFVEITRNSTNQCPVVITNQTIIVKFLTDLKDNLFRFDVDTDNEDFLSLPVYNVMIQVFIWPISFIFKNKYLFCLDQLHCRCFRDIRPAAAKTLAMLIPAVFALMLTTFRLLLLYVYSQEEEVWEDVLSLRCVIIWTSFILTYILTSTWCSVIHQSYQYFENLAEQFKVFTKASTHSTWYQFYRSFANKNDTSSRVSNDRKKIGKKIRDEKSFDLTNPSDLTGWNKARDKLVTIMTSGETTINEINLKMHTSLTAVFLVLSCLSSYILVVQRLSLTNSDSENGKGGVDVNYYVTPDSSMEEFGWIFLSICLFFLIPMLFSRYEVTGQDTKQLELLKSTKTRVEIHGIESKLDIIDYKDTIDALDIMIKKVKAVSFSFY